MIELWQHEHSRFTNLAKSQKVLWLSKLLFLISMLARETYQAGTTDVDAPKDLRRFNELIHRVSSFQLEIAAGKTKGMPDDKFFMMLSEAMNELGVDAAALINQINKI